MTFSIAGEEVMFRQAVPDDMNFIRATWMRSERDLSRLNQRKFFSWRRPVMEQHVERDRFVVACDAQKPSAIYGWVCMRHEVPIYVYVMGSLRGNGLRAELLRRGQDK